MFELLTRDELAELLHKMETGYRSCMRVARSISLGNSRRDNSAFAPHVAVASELSVLQVEVANTLYR